MMKITFRDRSISPIFLKRKSCTIFVTPKLLDRKISLLQIHTNIFYVGLTIKRSKKTKFLENAKLETESLKNKHYINIYIYIDF